MSQAPKRRINIVYCLPTYASCAFPRLAHELIEHISDFLWDEPVQLARCCLVCHAWYHAAHRHLTSWLVIRSNNALRDLVHILMSNLKQNGKYGRALQQLTILDDAQRAFAHTLSVRIPGCLLSSLDTLEFLHLDWTTSVRPHASFFISLTYFTSVTQLNLSTCHFHSADELHRIISALPRLEHLELYMVTIRAKQWEESQATPRHQFPRSKLTHLHVLEISTAHGELCLHQHQSFLDQLASYSTIVSLQLDMHYIPSFSQLQRFIRGFPALREVDLQDDPVWDLPEVSMDTALLRTDLSIDAWPKLHLIGMSSAVSLRFLELFTAQYRKVQRLCIDTLDLRSSALLQGIEKVMRESGPALTEFQWHCSSQDPFIENPEDQITPDLIPRLTYNTNLEMLEIDISTPTFQKMSWVCESLMTLLSQIKSTHLCELWIWFKLGYLPLDHTNLLAEGSIESIAAFRTMLCRPAFAQLPPRTVLISFLFCKDPDDIEPFARDVASAKIKTFMVPLLTLWLARGMLQLHLPDESMIPP